jgi:hypothetical protein
MKRLRLTPACSFACLELKNSPHCKIWYWLIRAVAYFAEISNNLRIDDDGDLPIKNIHSGAIISHALTAADMREGKIEQMNNLICST